MKGNCYQLVFYVICLLLAACGSGDFQPDPLRGDQWYINGTNDPNIESINLSNAKYKGRGVLVAIVDNGIDIFHEDLIDRIGIGSVNYLTDTHNFQDANHGTAVAGIIAATEGNGIGIRGIAPLSSVIGFNALKVSSISNLADALVREKERVWVSSNSWGDFNSWGEPFPLRSLIKQALKSGVTSGRFGRGIVYVFAAGNGATQNNGLPSDNVNYSGLVNNRYTIPVCAVDEYGKRPFYSETGATLIVCAPSKGDSQLGISTTDGTGELGYNPYTFPNDYADNGYTRNFGGTSASTPIVSGVVALLLEANPKLGWRDVRAILAKSARKNDSEDSDWVNNGAELHVNHKYGFGVVDANHAINLAKSWVNYRKEVIVEVLRVENKMIPDNDSLGLTSTISITQDLNVEFIDVFFDAPNHPRIGDLEISLVSPSGTQSILSEQHNQLFGVFRYNNWRFGTMRHLDESSKGVWKLLVKDRVAGSKANLLSWKLKIYGH